MDNYHRDIIHIHVKQAAKKIDGLLPAHPSHPEGRNPMAHIYSVIQEMMGCPAKECSVDRIDDILNIIQDCVDYVHIPDVSPFIRHKYKPHKKDKPATLDQFFS